VVLPARPAHPRDKPKVEVGVQIVERWILARLRNRRFFSLGELNAGLLSELNARPFKKLLAADEVPSTRWTGPRYGRCWRLAASWDAGNAPA
jgi:transposase